VIVVEPAVEPSGAKWRSRRTLIGVTVGVVVAGALVAYGLSRSDDNSEPVSSTPPTIGVIQSPAQVFTTQADVVVPGSGPATNDVPTVPTGTADVPFPPVSSDVLVP
jgi:hypothetical protein